MVCSSDYITLFLHHSQDTNIRLLGNCWVSSNTLPTIFFGFSDYSYEITLLFNGGSRTWYFPARICLEALRRQQFTVDLDSKNICRGLRRKYLLIIIRYDCLFVDIQSDVTALDTPTEV